MENREVRLIDANVFIKDLTAMKSAYDAIALDGMVKALKEAPTINLGDLWPHAKWTKDHMCTNCGEFALEAPEAHCYYHTIYCPHCGAFMDKED